MIRKVTIKDAQAIANIYNEYVLNSVASFETEPVTEQEMRRRIEEISSQFPYYVYEDMGEVEGYCYAHFPEVGMKFGRWLDVVDFQLILNEKASK